MSPHRSRSRSRSRSRARSGSQRRTFDPNIYSNYQYSAGGHSTKYYVHEPPAPAHLPSHRHNHGTTEFYTVTTTTTTNSDSSSSGRPPTTTFSLEKRRPTFMIIGVISSILLIVLVVTLSVGLTVSARSSSSGARSGSKNLPDGHNVYVGNAIRAGEDILGGGKRGGCGWKTYDGEDVVAVGWETFDNASKEEEEDGEGGGMNKLCGMRVRATRYRWENRPKGEGRDVSVDAMVAGRCAECNATDLAFTPSTFKKLADDLIDTVDIHWAFL